MKLIDPKAITIPEDRQRSVADPADLLDSISLRGIINPIVVDDELNLIAGERRLRAALQLGLEEVPVRIFSDLSDVEKQLIELEENVRRKDISWQEQADALKKIWKLKGKPSVRQLAEEIGWSEKTLGKYITVAQEVENNPDLQNVEKFHTAYKKVVKDKKRKEAAAIQEAIAPIEAEKRATLHHMKFEEWLEQHDGTLFNFIHVDFPYGVGMHTSGRNANYNPRMYEDTEDVYFHLLREFLKSEERFIAKDANILFWCSMRHYSQTVEAFTTAGFDVIPYPLVWSFGPTCGMFPDADRRPRRTYDTCLYIRKGDLPIIKMKADSFTLNPQTVDREHPSEKPEEVLRYWFEMFIDETSTVFDPTCGSASALKVAIELGAKYVEGVEMDEKFFSIAERRLKPWL